jgi:hypothetical protein
VASIHGVTPLSAMSFWNCPLAHCAGVDRLQKTYSPVNIATVRDVDASRREGRAKLRKSKPR